VRLQGIDDATISGRAVADVSHMLAELLDNALARLGQLAPRDVEAHASRLGAELIDGLKARGLTVLTPEAPEERAGNVCFAFDDAAGLAARLAAHGVLVWGGEGRVRVSPHVHCDRDDVGAFFEALDRVTARTVQHAGQRR